jgi:hypothetical protein
VCYTHHPDINRLEAVHKRLCRWCDIADGLTTFVCSDCRVRSNKKEWGVVAHLRKHFGRDRFVYDSSGMLRDGVDAACASRRRPDIYFPLRGRSHCVIVEVDENQHRGYNELCECARLNEIVNALNAGEHGVRSVVVIRFNPDAVRNASGLIQNMDMATRLSTLVDKIEQEIAQDPDDGGWCTDAFFVKVVQLFYNHGEVATPCNVQTMDVTHVVAV